MRDTISIDRVNKLHPKIKTEVATLINKVEAGFPTTMAVRVVQGLRTFAEQDALYAQGRTKPGSIVTNARGGQSNHNYGLAIDFAIIIDKDNNGSYETLSWSLTDDNDKDGQKDWMEVVNVFKAAGYDWGGEWHSLKDYPHIEKTFGLSVNQCLAKHNAGQVDSQGYILI